MDANEQLKIFVNQKAQERNLSLRQVAAGVGIGSSHLSAILNGKRPVSVDVCNSIADFFNVSRVSLYNLVGWLDLNKDDEFISELREFVNKNPEFEEFLREILAMKDTKEKERMLRLVRAGLGK